MAAGSGPQVNQVTAFVMPADTNEHVVCTLPPLNWAGSQLGNLLSFTVLVTGSATGTVTLRVRQGTAITGTQVGSSVVQSTSSAAVSTPAMEFQDVSAFATGPQTGAQYVLTAQGSVNSVATLTSALLEAETIAPLN
jgi:hypothetical protein